GVVPRDRPQHLPDVAPPEPPAETDRPVRRGGPRRVRRPRAATRRRRGAAGRVGGAAAGVPRGGGAAGTGGPVVQGGGRGDGRADRDGDVAAVPRPGPAATKDGRRPAGRGVTGD